MSEEQNKTEEILEQETTISSEIVELEWEEVEGIFSMRENLTNLEAHFSTMCLNFERRKTELLRTMLEYENAVYSLANQLKTEKSINPELTYELKLPQSPEQKAYFIRKDD